jgi:hypothetical protein
MIPEEQWPLHIEGAIPVSSTTYSGFQPGRGSQFHLMGAPISLCGAKNSTYGVNHNFIDWVFHSEEVFAVSTFRETAANEASGDNHEQ